MRKFNSCSYRMARYLWRKWCNGDISESMIERLFTDDGYCDVFGGWFADFHYESLLDWE